MGAHGQDAGRARVTGMSTWEDRMAAHAAERQAAAEAEEFLRDQADDPHAGHGTRLDGSAVYCSCGEFLGVTCVVIEDEPGPLG